MFSRPERLAKRTPKDGTDRYRYLRELVNEFTTTTVIEYQEQVLANLANFAYDPINYDFLRSLRVLDLFLDQVSVSSNPKLVQFALAGLCNLASDPVNGEYITRSGGVDRIIGCIYSDNEKIKLSAITTLIFLKLFIAKGVINSEIIEYLRKQTRSATDARLRNLAIIFLETYSDKSKEH